MEAFTVMSAQSPNTQSVKIVTADPSAIGLFGLAIVTLVASSQKLEFTTGLSYVIPWAIFPEHSRSYSPPFRMLSTTIPLV